MTLEDVAQLCGRNGSIGTMTWIGVMAMLNLENHQNIRNDISTFSDNRREYSIAQRVYEQARLDARCDA